MRSSDALQTLAEILMRNTFNIQTCYGIFMLFHQPIKSPECPATTGWAAQEPIRLSLYQLGPVCTTSKFGADNCQLQLTAVRPKPVVTKSAGMQDSLHLALVTNAQQ